MRRSLGVLFAGIVCLALYAAAQKLPSQSYVSQAQRYQLVTARVAVQPGTGEENALFLLDTATGRVWRYQGYTKYVLDQKETYERDKFVPVSVKEYDASGKLVDR